MCKNFTKKQPCNNCPYRTDAPLAHWSVLEYKNLLATQSDQMGAIFGCHKANGHVCVGWLMKQDENGFPSIALRLSLKKNHVIREYLDKLKSPAPLYDSVEQMCEAHYPEHFTFGLND